MLNKPTPVDRVPFKARSIRERRACASLKGQLCPWYVGLGMHVFRRFERQGASESPVFHSLRWFKSGGLFSQKLTTSSSRRSSDKLSEKQRCYVKKPLQRQSTTSYRKVSRGLCSSRIGSVPLFGERCNVACHARKVRKPLAPQIRDMKNRFGDADYQTYQKLTGGVGKRFFRPSTCIDKVHCSPDERALRLVRKFLKRFCFNNLGRGSFKLPNWMKRVPHWEVLVYINYRRAGRRGLFTWWKDHNRVLAANGLKPFDKPVQAPSPPIEYFNWAKFYRERDAREAAEREAAERVRREVAEREAAELAERERENFPALLEPVMEGSSSDEDLLTLTAEDYQRFQRAQDEDSEPESLL